VPKKSFRGNHTLWGWMRRSRRAERGDYFSGKHGRGVRLLVSGVMAYGEGDVRDGINVAFGAHCSGEDS